MRCVVYDTCFFAGVAVRGYLVFRAFPTELAVKGAVGVFMISLFVCAVVVVLPIYALLFITVCCAVGILVFRKKQLK